MLTLGLFPTENSVLSVPSGTQGANHELGRQQNLSCLAGKDSVESVEQLAARWRQG